MLEPCKRVLYHTLRMGEDHCSFFTVFVAVIFALSPMNFPFAVPVLHIAVTPHRCGHFAWGWRCVWTAVGSFYGVTVKCKCALCFLVIGKAFFELGFSGISVSKNFLAPADVNGWYVAIIDRAAVGSVDKFLFICCASGSSGILWSCVFSLVKPIAISIAIAHRISVGNLSSYFVLTNLFESCLASCTFLPRDAFVISLWCVSTYLPFEGPYTLVTSVWSAIFCVWGRWRAWRASASSLIVPRVFKARIIIRNPLVEFSQARFLCWANVFV